jgi:cytochrome c-type biogenesis protein CcmH/NrfG
LKESGERSRAEDAYRSALKIEPTDADAYLQLGHVLKIQGRPGEALEAYARAAELAPDNMSIREEFVILNRLHERDVSQPKPAAGSQNAVLKPPPV